MGEEPRRDSGEHWQNHYFATRITHGGQIKLVFMRVREMDGRGNQLYVHDVFIEDEIKAKASIQSSRRLNNPDRAELRSTDLYKSILQESYSTINLSISNAVDKNGEPAASW